MINQLEEFVRSGTMHTRTGKEDYIDFEYSFQVSDRTLICSNIPKYEYRDIKIICSNVKDLNGLPDLISGQFDCSLCDLESLEGSPKIVGTHFKCSSNKIESLYGSPKIIPGSFICDSCNIENVAFAPERIGVDLRLKTINSQT